MRTPYRLLATLLLTSSFGHAQPGAPGQEPLPPPPAPPPAEPAPAGQPPPAPVGQPPPAPAGQPPPAAPASNRPEREPVELHLLIGLGNAVCDNDKPNSDCPVDGGAAFGFGGGWRFHDHWSVGLEVGVWAFKVRDSWKGQLQDDATDVKFSSAYFAPFARWYWFEPGTFNPYLQAGIGFGTVTAEASNATAKYTYTARGLVYPVAIGLEWQLARIFRLGPQLGAYLHVSNEICEDQNGSETCRDPGKNPDGEREGVALPWRLVAVGTFTFGS